MNDLPKMINFQDRSLLIVDPEKRFTLRVANDFRLRGYTVDVLDTAEAGLTYIKTQPPAYALIELKLGTESGLELIEALTRVRPTSRSVIVTRFDNFVTAVQAIRLGAKNYLTKPADSNSIELALKTDEVSMVDPPSIPMTPARVRWEHIQRVFEQCGRNVSETSRHLSMHRRTLQRILSKHAPV
ncbi:MAG: response regulator [Alphaproteobacteria bacterium]|nr:response regulator [Alphaproteobacteria bacterium]